MSLGYDAIVGYYRKFDRYEIPRQMYTFMADISGHSVALGHSLPPWMAYARPVLPLFALLSILWTAWDPTYSVFRKAQIQGRDVRVQGRNTYIVCLLYNTPPQMQILTSIRFYKC
jgi:hypothetical protein